MGTPKGDDEENEAGAIDAMSSVLAQPCSHSATFFCRWF